LNLAFPNDNYPPAVLSKRADYPFVTRYVVVDLDVPEINIRLGAFCGATIPVTMPETAMNENRRAKTG
jgi:hypothetical protein